ncbi:DNA primase [Mucilaginibacter sp.]
MISEQSIQEVRDRADLLDVVKKYSNIKKKGANYVGDCPFHDEKSGSFTVSPAKGMFKCFGCGVGGQDAIKFIMEKERMDFPASVKYLANWFNVTLEETKKDDEPPEQLVKKADYTNINKRVAKLYQKNLLSLKCANWPNQPVNPVIDELLNIRKLTNSSIVNFELGFAPDDYRFITPILMERGMFAAAEDIGLVKTSNNTNFDIYRNRIMFPIHNERGEIIGFGGRKLEDGKKDNPKYINSRDSLIYKKESILYGIYQAARAIREMKFAVLVEGYYDVISFHQTGMPNTVAPCGTAFTDGHAKILKRYTQHIILIGDQDAAGQKANLKNVDLLLRYGFKVDICQLPEKHDPDSFSREFKAMEDIAA